MARQRNRPRDVVGLINWLFRRSRLLLARNDPDFGKIEFIQGAWRSLPLNSSFAIMISVDAGEAGPSVQQRQLLKQLVGNLASYEAQGRAFVDQHRSDHKELVIYALEIPNDDEVSRGQFTIEYADAQADTIYRAEFVDFKPRHYGEDD